MATKRKTDAEIPEEESDILLIRPLLVDYFYLLGNTLCKQLHIEILSIFSFVCFFFEYFSGAGQEVGRSCIMLEFKGKKIMLDCGIHPGLSGMDALPFVDLIEADEVDLLFISQ